MSIFSLEIFWRAIGQFIRRIHRLVLVPDLVSAVLIKCCHFFLAQAPILLAFKEWLGRKEDNPRSRESSDYICFNCSGYHRRSRRFLFTLWILSGIGSRNSVDFRVSKHRFFRTCQAEGYAIGCSETVFHQGTVAHGQLRIWVSFGEKRVGTIVAHWCRKWGNKDIRPRL